MAKKNDTRFFENKLLDFVAAKDPLLEMLQWMMDKFMEIEVARKTGAPKGSHSQTRTGYRAFAVARFGRDAVYVNDNGDENQGKAELWLRTGTRN